MNKRWILLSILAIASIIMLVLGAAINGCSSPILSSDVVPDIREHSFEFLASKQLDIRLPHDHCPKGMVLIDRKDAFYCVDQYEWPNQAGAYPVAAITAYEAERLCRSVGKRLCSIAEWRTACFGKEEFAYSYGPIHKDYCNDHAIGYIQPRWELMYPLSRWRVYAKGLYKGVPNGSEPFCKSDEGVYELIGNTREWIRNPGGMGGYGIAGGYWFGTMQGLPTCLSSITNHSPGFASYEFGARCCLDAQ